MDTVGKAASTGKAASIGRVVPGILQPGMIEATARRALPLDLSREARGPASIAGHVCAVPGYLQLPGLAMLWQCSACGGAWRLVADEWLPGSPPLEFTWVRDHNTRGEVRQGGLTE